MTRKILVMLVGMVVVGTVLAAPASAGGFCSDPAADLYSDESGDLVAMAESCFSPTVLRVRPGDTVTFVNKDAEFHAVGGVAGTFGDMHREIASEERVRITFEEEGIFPYVCILHPGMGGAIVVGDGRGDASALLPVGHEDKTRSASSNAGAAIEPEGAGAVAWWGLGAALVAGLGAAGLIMLRRRSASALQAASSSVGHRPTT
jgi:plastocyanin